MQQRSEPRTMSLGTADMTATDRNGPCCVCPDAGTTSSTTQDTHATSRGVPGPVMAKEESRGSSLLHPHATSCPDLFARRRCGRRRDDRGANVALQGAERATDASCVQAIGGFL
jgi:hypothetical protein